MKVVEFKDKAVSFDEVVARTKQTMTERELTPQQVAIIVLSKAEDGFFDLGIVFNDIPRLEALALLEYAKQSLAADIMGL